MQTDELALARQRTYSLLGRLYLEGVTAVTLPTITAISELGKVLPLIFDADEAAAAHQTLFGFNVYPYESIFLDSSGLLGGSVTDGLRASYWKMGCQVEFDSTSPDHIGHELQGLAHLCAAEADAWEDDLASVARRMQNNQRDFMQSHLLRWLLPFVLAVKQQERPFFTALADLTLDFVLDHFADVSGIGPKEKPEENKPVEIVQELNLDDEKTTLKDIAQYLTTPLYAGIFLGRDDVARLARQCDLPRGFGDRSQMLANLMRSAVQYDAFPKMLDSVQRLCDQWVSEYGRYATNPLFSSFVTPWQRRAKQTSQLLVQIQTQAKIKN